jgi:hypothetical protein
MLTRLQKLTVLTTIAALTCGWSGIALADEDGVSFWLPGTYGSLAAAPLQPGWALGVVYYHATVSAGGSVAAARQITIGKFDSTVNVSLDAKVKSRANVAVIDPNYTFTSPILGGQLALDMAWIVGGMTTDLTGTLTASSGSSIITRQGMLSDTFGGSGDLYPRAAVRWNNGVNSWMVYSMGDIPVGPYNSRRLSNLGIGHGAIDGGGGYTYLDPSTGHEFSAVTGFTYNFTNQDTNYQSGVDWHLDWGASQFLSKQAAVGLVGYFYEQIGADSGCHPLICPFKSGVIGIGPQATYLFPVGQMQGYLNLKGYGEFAGHNRADGWNLWLTFAISPERPS